jgi:rubrerythrin
MAATAIWAKGKTMMKMIEADKAMKIVREECVGFMTDSEIFTQADLSLLSLNKVINTRIRALPYTEAELVQCDEWNVLEGKLGDYATLHCKKCGTTFNDVSSWKYHYCPNCGAKMEGVK